MDAGLNPHSRWWTGFETSVIAGFVSLFGLSCELLGTSVCYPNQNHDCIQYPLQGNAGGTRRHITILDPPPGKQGRWMIWPTAEKDKTSIW